jgi:putative mRNA 3-end processing factor
LWGAKNTGIPPLDGVITESTYATATHEPRLEVERKFIDSVKAVLSRNGTALIPAFGVARSQEILSILQSYGLTRQRNIVIDGMAREVSKTFLKHTDFLRTVYSIDNVNLIRRRRSIHERRKAIDRADIIIAPSGMLKGGTVRFYAPRVLPDKKNGLFLVSYQVEGTPGRILLEEGYYEDDDYSMGREAEDVVPKRKVDVEATVGQYDFSSHCDGNDLLKFLKSLEFRNNGEEPYILCVHGDRDNCDYLAGRINEEIPGVRGVAPKFGEEYSI